MSDMAVTHPLDKFFASHSPGKGEGVQVEIIKDRGIVQVFAIKGKTSAVEKALGIKTAAGQASVTDNHTALPVLPDQWLLVSQSANEDGNYSSDIQAKLKNNGYVSEQSDSRVIFRLSGPRVRELMQKGCRLDLHPQVTGEGWCAQTQMAQVGVLIHQLDDAPIYDLYVYSGFSQDFAEWLEHTGAQLGLSFTL